MLTGTYSDFNKIWFKVIGNTLVGTMMFTMVFPIMEVMCYYCLRLFFRFLDSGPSMSPAKTRLTSVQAFIDTYAGPKYLMYYNVSQLLNIAFVTMMYGYGIPVLFPIAALSFII